MQKTKRRGRPPGSKNKKTAGFMNTAKMEAEALRDYIGKLQGLLAAKISAQKQDLEAQLARLTGFVSSNGAPQRSIRKARGAKRAKAKPKYQSKKKPGLKWSGRGMTPVWMREEMKGTKLTKGDFLIKA